MNTPSSTHITAHALTDRLQAALQPSVLHVEDESWQHAGHSGANDSGAGTHFRVVIGGPAFDGLSRVRQHRLVYDALQDFMRQGLHALAIEIR